MIVVARLYNFYGYFSLVLYFIFYFVQQVVQHNRDLKVNFLVITHAFSVSLNQNNAH